MDIKLFQQKLNEICEIAEENGKQLSQQQIRDHFDESDLSTSQLVKILQYLKLKGITIEGADEGTGAARADAVSSESSDKEELPGTRAALTAEEQSQLSGLLEKLISSSECQYASDEEGKAFGDQPHRGHRRQRENHSGNLGRRSFSLGKQSVSGCPIFEERSRRAGLSEQNCQLSQQELGEKE